MTEEATHFTIRRNPYHEPIRSFVGQLRSISMSPPWIPQLVQAIVLVFLILVFSCLYPTIGIVDQIYNMFRSLMQQSRDSMKPRAAVENSAYAVSIGVYFVLSLPFLIVLLPFRFVGAVLNYAPFGGAFVLIVIATLLWLFFFHSDYLAHLARLIGLRPHAVGLPN